MRFLWVGLTVLLLTGCRPATGPQTAAEARDLLRKAIAAHGGAERLRQFDQFHLVSEGTFKEAASLRRTVDYGGRDQWAMSVVFPQATLRIGVAESRCWKQERYRVDSCTGDEEQREAFWSAIEHNVWVLPTIDVATVEPAPGDLPGIRSGDLALFFDADSHLLREIHHGSRVDVLSDYREIAGVQVAGRRQVLLDGEPDVDEHWQEILPGRPDPAALTPPAPIAAGVVRDDIDAARQVAWVELEEPLVAASRAVERMDAAIRQLGRNPSCSDGLIWTPPADGDTSGRWRLAVGIEIGEPLTVEESGGVHFASWPPMREIGLYFSGRVLRFAELRPQLEQLARARGLDPADLRLEVLTSRDVLAAPEKGLSMLRLVPR